MNRFKLVAVGVFFSTITLWAQPFEGSVEFSMQTLTDTVSNTYYVKGNNVKIDQMGRKSGRIEGGFLFDLGANTIKFINPVRKVWGEHVNKSTTAIKGSCVVTKGVKPKTIQGQKCTEYVVKNTEENTQITYWIAQNQFDFFTPMLKLWNRKEKQAIYFSQITDLPKGAMPLLSEEKNMSDGKLISKLEVKKIAKTKVADSKFVVPADYKRFEQ